MNDELYEIKYQMLNVLANIDHRTRLDHTNRMLGDLARMLEAYFMERCEPPETLGVSVGDGVGTRETFGERWKVEG